MLFGVFLTLGVGVLSIGLRSFQNSYLQKAGALGILVATYLAVYFISGSWIWGLAAAVGWLFLLRLEIHASVPHQSTAGGSIVLAALSKSSRVSPAERR